MPKFDSNSAKEARAKAKGRGESKIKKLIKEAVDANSTLKVWETLTNLAINGDMDAIKTYLGYVIGKPKESIVIGGDPDAPVLFQLDKRFGS